MALVGSKWVQFNLKSIIRSFSSQKSFVKPVEPSRRWRYIGVGFGAASIAGGALYFSLTEKERRVIRVTLGGVNRFFRSSYIAGRIILKYSWATYGLQEDDPKYVEALEGAHKQSAELILNGCLRNGGLYIKLGQGLVIMDHILPKEYIDTLRVLQDKCLVRKPDEVHQLFLEDFGKPVNEVFDKFEENPVAAASLAQVFRGKTKTGEEVAIKAQYIDLRDRFVGDIATLTILLNFAGWLHPDFDFAWVLNELKGTLEKELNFLNEGHNGERCAKDLKDFPFVYVPKIYWDLTTPRILTTEWIDGIKISDKEKLLSEKFSLADIDYKLFKTFAEQIFHTGFVHADPHPGNILIRRGPDKKAQLVLLDHGLYETVPDNVRESLRQLWKSIVLNDHDSMKKYSVELGIDAKDYRLFCIALGQRYIKNPNPSEKDEETVRIFLARRTVKKKRNKLTKEEKAKIESELLVLQRRFMNVFKSMPSKMMLVTRNINTIRSIAHGHGDPINRYKTMARCATQGTFVHSYDSSSKVMSLFRKYKERIHFEVQLWWGGMKIFLFSYFMRLAEFVSGTNIHGLPHY
ncbi:hypothetical protein O3M35_001602 [Rhynocoris fuscipes]|uniref:ABC1 atypical kinase-like domain-containing protein n=1 Tax=Rhynocoris fuscipes TaxID=488301 RepID=A0AAW1CVL0_9HEMI